MALPLLAQETGRWEIGGFGGGSFGSRIAMTPSADTRIGNGAAFGLRGAFALDQRFRLEVSLSRANTSVGTFSPATGASLAPAIPAHVDTYELDALYGFGGRRLRGYLGLGAGAMSLPGLGAAAASGRDTRFAANVAVGGELFLDQHLGLRLDARYRFRVIDRHVGTVICESGVCSPFPTNLYSSAEVSAGVTYRFGPPLGAGAFSTGRSGSGSEGDGGEANPPRRLGMAAFEIGVMLNLFPWTLNRYEQHADFARVTPARLRDNFLSGFTYDRDAFSTNQFEHGFHGSLYFNAARSNGFDFWESGVFTFLGSYLWECCTEIEPPAINDLVNTTLGGMAAGEISHRLAAMVLDSTLSGWPRFWHEVGAHMLDPIGGLNRIFRGDVTRNSPNPDDRLPSRFLLDLDVGYRHIGGSAKYPDQGLLSISMLYGDPFAGEISKPFDSFSFRFDLGHPAIGRLARAEQEGLLKGWELSDSEAPNRYILGLLLGYEYRNNEVETFGTESFGVGLLARHRIGADLQAVTGLSASVFPLAAVKTADAIDPLSGRSYDYGPGGGVRLEGALRAAGREIASVSYGIAWTATGDGTSTGNTLQFLQASARVPLGEKFGAGAGYAWYSRETAFPRFPNGRRSQSEWRVFLTRTP